MSSVSRTTTRSFAAVRSGAVDVWYLDAPIGREYVQRNAAAKLKLVGVKPFESGPAAYALKQGNTALLGQINTGLADVIKDGTWVQLYKKYFPGAPIPKQFAAS